MNDTENENEIGLPQRLPLWKGVVDEMRASGMHFGQVFSSEWFEERLKVKRDTMRFGLDISDIRRELEKDGFAMTGRGQKGDQQVILPLRDNVKIMEGYQRRAFDALKRGVILGTNSPIHLLPDDDRRKHEGMLERMATRLILMQRSQKVVKVIREHDQSILPQKAS